MKQIRFIRSDGQVLVADGTSRRTNAQIGIMNTEGFDSPTIEVFRSKNAVGNGSVKTGARFGERSLQIVGDTKLDNSGLLHRKVISFFTTQDEIRVEATRKGVTRWTVGTVDGFKVTLDNEHDVSGIDVSILCTESFLNDMDTNGTTLSSETPMMHYPYAVETTFATSVLERIYEKYIFNGGDAPTRPRVTLEINGDVTNPIFYIGNKFVKIIKVLKVGDFIEINFGDDIYDTSGKVVSKGHSVTLNGVLVMQDVTSDSDITETYLNVGDNLIRIDAEKGKDLIAANMFYNIKYGGV